MPTRTTTPAITPPDGGRRERPLLTRRRVLEAALAFVDEHGLDAVTMRKLGAALGVEGTALYNHVQGKDGLLDGLVELLWSEVHSATDTSGRWQDVLRSAARATRDVVRRHPQVAPLVCGRSVMPVEALQLYGSCLARMEQSGFDREHASQAMCAVIGHAFGYAVMEQFAGGVGSDDAPESDAQRIRRVAQMLPRDVPDDLFEVGLAVCSCGATSQFEAGVDLIIGGLRPRRPRPR